MNITYGLFGWATNEEIEQMKHLTFSTNSVLVSLFRDAGIILVDFKLEFGRYENRLLLGDGIHSRWLQDFGIWKQKKSLIKTDFGKGWEM